MFGPCFVMYIVLSVLNSFANFSLRKRAELIVVLLSSWADPEGGDSVRTPWSTTSGIGFHRNKQ